MVVPDIRYSKNMLKKYVLMTWVLYCTCSTTWPREEIGCLGVLIINQ